MDNVADNDLLTLEQAGEYLGVSRSKLSYMIKSGKLVTTQIDGRPYFNSSVLKRFKATYEPRTQWSLESAIAESRKFKSLALFQQLSGGAYHYLRLKHPAELKKILLSWRVKN